MSEKYSVLIVEKDREVCGQLIDFLESEGDFHIIKVMHSGTGVEDICKSTKIHLVLLGTSIEESTKQGINFARLLFKLYGTPVVFIASSKEKDHIKRFALDSYGYIVKPFSRDQLLSSVYLALQKARLEKRLLEAQKLRALSIFAAGVAHDFNNILGAIIGYSELIKLKTGGNDQVGKYVNLILKACMRGKQLIDHLMTFSRQFDHTKKYSFPLHIILKETIKYVKSEMFEDVLISEDIIKEGDLISADPSKVHQLCLNLLVNACEAVKGINGSVAVSLKREKCPVTMEDLLDSQECLVLEIRDTGEGMDEDVRERIFEPFFSTKQGATGLGLSVVHGIVTEIGGEIFVDSKPGKGTIVRVILPVAQEGEALY